MSINKILKFTKGGGFVGYISVSYYNLDTKRWMRIKGYHKNNTVPDDSCFDRVMTPEQVAAVQYVYDNIDKLDKSYGVAGPNVRIYDGIYETIEMKGKWIGFGPDYFKLPDEFSRHFAIFDRDSGYNEYVKSILKSSDTQTGGMLKKRKYILVKAR